MLFDDSQKMVAGAESGSPVGGTSHHPSAQAGEELVGIYRAQVPVESYMDTGDFYVHFFPNGRVRIVVSNFSPDSKQHPIQGGDLEAGRSATAGVVVDSFYTKEEMAELERETSRERAQFGDWR